MTLKLKINYLIYFVLLGKHLHLKQRVITVWFQNARQKARKSNTPGSATNSHFTGSNKSPSNSSQDYENNEEEPEDVEVSHLWEHSTQERQVREISPEDYIALQEQCRSGANLDRKSNENRSDNFWPNCLPNKKELLLPGPLHTSRLG